VGSGYFRLTDVHGNLVESYLPEHPGLAKSEAAMDEPERDYLRQRIKELERAKGRWKALALALLAGLALFLLVGGMGSVLTLGLFQARRQEALMEAEMAAARARELEVLAKQAKENEAKQQSKKAAEPGK
jgi:hypothetical protein